MAIGNGPERRIKTGAASMRRRVMDLTETQTRMLRAGQFHVDGWCGRTVVTEAERLRRAGYLERFVGGDDQYTSWNYTITESGKRALEDPSNDPA